MSTSMTTPNSKVWSKNNDGYLPKELAWSISMEQPKNSLHLIKYLVDFNQWKVDTDKKDSELKLKEGIYQNNQMMSMKLVCWI